MTAEGRTASPTTPAEHQLSCQMHETGGICTCGVQAFADQAAADYEAMIAEAKAGRVGDPSLDLKMLDVPVAGIRLRPSSDVGSSDATSNETGTSLGGSR